MPTAFMQRRHFDLIAEALRDTRPIKREGHELQFDRWLEVVNTFAMRLKRTNDSFNRDRFLRACGVED